MKPNPSEKFVELAEKRVNRALKDIKLIGNLANRSNYSYTDQQVAKICKALRGAVKDCEKRFEQGESRGEDGFRL